MQDHDHAVDPVRALAAAGRHHAGVGRRLPGEVVGEDRGVLEREGGEVYFLYGAEDEVAVVERLDAGGVVGAGGYFLVQVLAHSLGVDDVERLAVCADADAGRVPAGGDAAEQLRRGGRGRVEHGHRVDARLGDVGALLVGRDRDGVGGGAAEPDGGIGILAHRRGEREVEVVRRGAVGGNDGDGVVVRLGHVEDRVRAGAHQRHRRRVRVADLVRVVEGLAEELAGLDDGVGRISARHRDHPRRRGLRRARRGVGLRDVEAVGLIGSCGAEGDQVAGNVIGGLGKLVVADSPVADVDRGAVGAHLDAVGEEADRELLHHRVGGGLDDREAVVAVAGDIEELAVGAQRQAGREGDRGGSGAAAELGRDGRLVAARVRGVHRRARNVVVHVAGVVRMDGRDGDAGGRAGRDGAGRADGEELDRVVAAARRIERVRPGAGGGEADEHLAGVDLRNQGHAGGIDDRDGVAADVGRVLQRGRAAAALVVVGGDQVLAVGRERGAERVHADLRADARGLDDAAVGQHAVEVLAVELLRSGEQLGRVVGGGGLEHPRHRGGNFAPANGAGGSAVRAAGGQARQRERGEDLRHDGFAADHQISLT